MPITAVRGGSADDGSLALTPRYEGALMKLPRRELTLKRRALLAEGCSACGGGRAGATGQLPCAMGTND
jgi:hypothetical protein